MKPGAVSAVLFAVVFATYAIYLRVFGDPHFYYDAASYWQLGGTFGAAGHFSLLDFDSTIRGYSLPLLNRALSSVAAHTGLGSIAIVQIFGALEIALLGTVLVPRLIRVLWPAARVTPVRILVFNAILFFFWRDHLGFPLSDFPAATLALIGLLALSRRTPLGYVVAGLSLGLAWNVRQAYIATLALALVLVVVRSGIRRTPLLAARSACLIIAGVLLVSIPQMLINNENVGSWSPTIAHAEKLNMIQLAYGMQGQKNETNVGTAYPSPSVVYFDPSTRRILAPDGGVVRTYSHYLEIVRDHPTEMVAAWARRFFNGLDVRYSTVYIHDLNATTVWFSLLNYSLIFVALARMLLPAFRRRLGRIGWPEAIVLCAACLLALPTAMEPRYFLPIQLVVYSLVVFGTGTRAGWAELGRSGQIGLAVLYPAFLLLCVTLSTSTVALSQFPT